MIVPALNEGVAFSLDKRFLSVFAQFAAKRVLKTIPIYFFAHLNPPPC